MANNRDFLKLTTYSMLSLVVVAVLVLSCLGFMGKKPVAPTAGKVPLTAMPIRLARAFSEDKVAILLKTDNSYILAISPYYAYPTEIVQAVALTENAISDGGKIQLEGCYSPKNKFVIENILANGIQVHFRQSGELYQEKDL
ncbi:hypothetical protein HYT92_01540 [Candidatus Pacearchaeota archaeon]|nr:hypothetical protein [Candidatus Pacearchaeota archaeon]